jgi:hypothetical protein
MDRQGVPALAGEAQHANRGIPALIDRTEAVVKQLREALPEAGLPEAGSSIHLVALVRRASWTVMKNLLSDGAIGCGPAFQF